MNGILLTVNVADLNSYLPKRSAMALVVLSGSKAYGTDHPESDDDLRGMYVTDSASMLSLTPPAPSVSATDQDFQASELLKFVRDASSKVNVVEQLFCPVLWASPAGQLLVEHRELFLSKRLSMSYSGYAVSQMRRAADGVAGSSSTDPQKRHKFRLHVVRLMETGLRLFQTGELDVRVENADRAHDMADWSHDRLNDWVESMDQQLNDAVSRSSLPERTSTAKLNELMFEVRNLHAAS